MITELECKNNQEIVERLKKRIEELTDKPLLFNRDLEKELQKILGEKE